MSFPTLFELTASAHPAADWNNGLLLIIDAQNEYRMGDMQLPGVEPAAAQIKRLLDKARASGTPVIHVRHIGVSGYLFDPEGERGRIFDELTPLQGEAVVDKPLPNAFAGSNLQDCIEATGRKQLIVCGYMTHMCVSATVRAAKDLGYLSTVVGAACATRALPGAEDPDVLHRQELAALADFFATLVEDASVLGA